MKTELKSIGIQGLAIWCPLVPVGSVSRTLQMPKTMIDQVLGVLVEIPNTMHAI